MTTTTPTSLYSPQHLRSFFEPKSIALVDASEKSTWSLFTHANLLGRKYPEKLYYVNPQSQTVHGQPTVARLADIGKPVDLAFVMVPPEVVHASFQ
jgi:acyl-CoA synthetase (NDP forming)